MESESEGAVEAIPIMSVEVQIAQSAELNFPVLALLVNHETEEPLTLALRASDVLGLIATLSAGLVQMTAEIAEEVAVVQLREELEDGIE